MSEHELSVVTAQTSDQPKTESTASLQKRAWDTPKLEDVSEQVMAQPYIRFT